MKAIVACESGYDINTQSNYRYTEKNAPRGYKAGDREQSYGLVQIHVPVHPVTKEQAITPVFAVDWMAQRVANGQAGIWTCYTQMMAMR